MKLWEIVKGIEEGTYKEGTMFSARYTDGDRQYAKIGSYGCLWWLEPKTGRELQHVYVSSFCEDVWRLEEEF